jgi:hypothetical protein
MEPKRIIMLFMFVGSAVGSMLPVLWGGSSFSFASVICAALGGAAGIYLGFKLSR